MPSIQDLPTELLENILTLLSVSDLVKTRRVCRRWQSLCDGTGISSPRRQVSDLYRKVVTTGQSYSAIRHRVTPFLDHDFDPTAYLSRLETTVPPIFSMWLLEYPQDGLIGWHWPGLQDEHSKFRHDELGIDWVESTAFSRHMKPGYSLLSESTVDELRFPLQPQDNAVLAMDHDRLQSLGWSEPCNGIIWAKALRVWVNWAGGEPEVTWLLLSGAGPYNGSVWSTLPEARFTVQSITDVGRVSKLSWDRKLADSWVEYLDQEWRSLRFRYDCLPRFERLRAGGRIFVRETH